MLLYEVSVICFVNNTLLLKHISSFIERFIHQNEMADHDV